MSAQPSMWGPFYKQSFTNRNLSTSPLTVGGLKGDTYDYKLIVVQYGVGSNAVVSVRPNGDSGTNYRRYRLYGGGSTVNVEYDNTNYNTWPINSTGTNSNHAGVFIGEITGKSGAERVMSFICSRNYDTTYYSQFGDYYWKNTADELTSLVFHGDNVAINFDLIILQKSKLAQDAEWELVGKKDFANVNLNSVFTGFSGLDGDRDEEYLLKLDVSYMSVNNDYVGVRINGDGGNSTYRNILLRNNVGTAESGTTLLSIGALWGSGKYGGFPMVHEFCIKAKSGQYRQAFSKYRGPVSGIDSTWWLNTADKIENLRFCTWNNGTTVSGSATLYRRGKSVSASKPTFETLKEVDVDGEFSQGQTFDLAGLGVPDADNESMLVLEWTGVSKTAGQNNLFITAVLNGDTGANYATQWLYADGSTATAWYTGTWDKLGQACANATYPCVTRMYLFPKSGKYRPALMEQGEYRADLGTYRVESAASWWLNTADKLRSIKVYAASANQTQFKGKITLKRLVF